MAETSLISLTPATIPLYESATNHCRPVVSVILFQSSTYLREVQLIFFISHVLPSRSTYIE